MVYPLSHNYIKFLNEEGSSGLTYDQWMDRKLRKTSEKQIPLNKGKDVLNKYSKFR